MPLFDQRTGKVVLTVLVITAAIAFIWAAWQVLAAFLFAIFFAYLVDPIVRFIAAHAHVSRGKAIAAVYFMLCVALAILVLFVGPIIVHEAQRLANTLPALYEKITSGQIAFQIGAQHGWSHETSLRIQQFLAGHRDTILAIAGSFGEWLADIGRNSWWLLLIPILAVFFLKDGGQFSTAALEVFERRRQREFLEGVLNDVNWMLAHYIRAQLMLSALTMAAYVAGLGLLKVPYALVLGIIGGVLEFIPMVGPFVAFVLIVGVAIGSGFHHVLWLIIFLVCWRGLQDYITSPRIMGGKLKLPPLAVLFGVLAGAEVAGIMGVYLSVPLMATARIIWRRWRFYQYLNSPSTEEAATKCSSVRDSRG